MIELLVAALQRHGMAVTPELARELGTLVADGSPEVSPEAETLVILPQSTPAPTGGGGLLSIEDSDGDMEIPPRYRFCGLIGRGGMGRVFEVHDHVLGRNVAMKVARRGLTEAAASRFVAEAQATSQLEHPGIVPVYDLGRLPSGEAFYTMPLIRGRTLSDLIGAVHRAAGPLGAWVPSPTGVTFRRLVSHLFAVCEALAYAHTRGVVHRDLKPDNIMVGDFGITLVLDWGLARVVGQTDPRPDPSPSEAIRTTRTSMDSLGTLDGTVVGTPGYLAPEQARGEACDARADVHALGAVLYEVLTGKPPFHGPSRFDTLAAVLHTAAVPPRRTAGPVPEELGALAMACLAKSPDDRPADAGVLSRRLSEWIEGTLKRERALAEVDAADRLSAEVTQLRDRANTLEARAEEALRGVPPSAPDVRKRAGWRMQDQATEHRRRAEVLQTQHLQSLQAALRADPDLPDAHRRLAAHYRGVHAAAEAAGRVGEAEAIELLLRAHDRGEHEGYLTGQGEITVHTEPAGAEVTVFRYELQDRRLVAVPFGRLGTTPIHAELPMGSYRLVLRHPDRAKVKLPVLVERCGHWNAIPPGGTQPLPIPLPHEDALGPEDLYVPAGMFLAGGDPDANLPRPGEVVWVDGFVIRRHPVTNEQFIRFLDDLVAQGRDDEALRHAPRMLGADEPIYGRDADGRFVLRPDEQGHEWHPRFPVVLVDWVAARAYAAWEAERSGLPWRLPWELEWEKAARGVDGRRFPWGDFADPSWLNVRDRTESPYPAVVEECPTDVGPYGVRGQGGNCLDWCMDVFDRQGVHPPGAEVPGDDDTQRVLRGSEWFGGLRMARGASRAPSVQQNREAAIGFRLARGL